MSRPWLSALVPTCNGEAYLAQALDSVVLQPSGVEVVAVDDGSTDDTVALLDAYRGRLDIRVIVRRAGNWVANTNLALSEARGEIVSILHQDDFWMPGRLDALRAAIASVPDASLWLHASRFVGPSGRFLGHWRAPLPAERPVSPSACLERLLVHNFVAVPAAAFSRERALALGGLDESLWYTADWDLWLRLAAAGPTVYSPRALCAFRIHPESQTAARSRALEPFRRQYETIVERHIDGWVAPSPQARASVVRVARASIELNVALAAAYHRQSLPWRRLAGALARLRPGDWRRLGRDSRLGERVVARVRARLSPAPVTRRRARDGERE